MTATAASRMLRDDPALGFWLSYAERGGALIEDEAEYALVVLPTELQRRCELPEEVSVTASPDVAREDGAALLIAGHPAVERAADAVLAAGDAGRAYLPWPGSRAPTRAELLSSARELAGIEHGRIDPAGEPVAAYLPLLRVGALVSYSASLTLRFQEQQQAVLDATTQLEPSERVRELVSGGRWLARPDGHGRAVRADVPAALAVADALIEQRAAARAAALAAGARRTLDAELARTGAYYEQALAAIARRRAGAAPDRQRLLDARADATRAERERRRREIEDEYRPRHDLRPFRLQLICVPAYLLSVVVRCGSAAFDLRLTWVPSAREFTASRCPTCGAAEPLIATRRRLACRSCR